MLFLFLFFNSYSNKNFYFPDITTDGTFYDGADEESSPVDLQPHPESFPSQSPLRVAPSDAPTVVINRDNLTSVGEIT